MRDRGAWLGMLLAAGGCAGSSARPGGTPGRPGDTPGCPRVASIHCEGSVDRNGTGAVVVRCRGPARAADEILVFWRSGAHDPFRPAPVERTSVCEVRASFPTEGAEEIYVAVVAASGAVVLESRPVRVTSLGQIAEAPEKPVGTWRRFGDAGRSDAVGMHVGKGGEMPLGAQGPREERYAGWVILVDLASLVTIPFVVGAIGALVGAPIVHGLHGNGSAAGKSLLLRVVVPLVVIGGSFLAFRAGSDCENNAEDGCFFEFMGALLLGGVSLAVVMVVDWTVLAKRRVEPAVAPHARRGLDRPPTWSPMVRAHEGGLVIVVQTRW